MQDILDNLIVKTMQAKAVKRGEVIQSLWSGYGEIVRYHLQGAKQVSVVVKHVKFPSEVHHPRGWHNDVSHQRKVKSYEIEMAWYQHWASRCNDRCRIPHCYVSQSIEDDHIMLLEDLDAAGFSVRKSNVDLQGVRLCLQWLAFFHAQFMGEKPQYLWPVGTYWHLATRPNELAAMHDKALQEAAPVIDSMLSCAKYQTFLHGDAKLANFCFSDDGRAVAAVDFQYVGGGCGMKDVAYFLGSCLTDKEHELHEEKLLTDYFNYLKYEIEKQGNPLDVVALEYEWRSLYPIAQTDFYRFLQGWMPTHWKINNYNAQVAVRVLQNL